MERFQTVESYTAYTVGWIAALPHERAAATVMLDEQHGKPLDFIQPLNDDNVYTWGRIGDHNVVIASLEAGVYGTTSATLTANSMLSSFPQIKIGLLVGIGAGIPRLEDDVDIRLGDVVISQPDGNTGGVVQHDFFQAKAGHVRESKSFLNKPPPVLLKALSRIQEHHERRPPRVPDFLAKIIEANPQMAKVRQGKPTYVHQGAENDRLFKPTYIHVSGRNCHACDAAEEITRDKRDSTDPEFHYGIIASGNSLVKDAIFRDELVKQIPGGNCLCLEMEAAGLMSNFPCLVIRGICDYADTHKNDRWQRYAAITAAAYAKELLGFVPVQEVGRAQRATELMGIAGTIQSIHRSMVETKDETRRERIVKWLAAPHVYTDYKRAKRQHHQGTSTWFMEHEKFKEWKNRSGSFLWIFGIPGCGKTILSSAVIHQLDPSATPESVTLYFFFSFTDSSKKNLENMLRSLVLQLASQSAKAWDVLDKFYHTCTTEKYPLDPEALGDKFNLMTEFFKQINIVLDALDEADPLSRPEILSWIANNFQGLSGNVRLLVTSRCEYDIECELSHLDMALRVPFDGVNEDIRMYVHARVRTHPALKRWRSRQDVQKIVEDALSDNSDGMFRWAACQLDALENCLDFPTLKRTLDSLPKTLDDTYSRILEQIPSEYQLASIKLLQLLICCERPLSLREAVDALAVDPSKEPAFDCQDRMPEPEEVARLCSSLVSIDKNDVDSGLSVLRIAHFTVKGYLASNRITPQFQEHFSMTKANAQTCELSIGYLLSIPWPAQLSGSELDSTLSKLHSEFPFLKYAIAKWYVHARAARNDERAIGCAIRLFTNRACLYAIFLDGYTYYLQKIITQEDPFNIADMAIPNTLLCAGTFELFDVAHHILATNATPESSVSDPTNRNQESRRLFHDGRRLSYRRLDGTWDFISPLYYYAMKGASGIVKTLLSSGIRVLEEGGPCGTALDVSVKCWEWELDINKILRKAAEEFLDDSETCSTAFAEASIHQVYLMTRDSTICKRKPDLDAPRVLRMIKSAVIMDDPVVSHNLFQTYAGFLSEEQWSIINEWLRFHLHRNLPYIKHHYASAKLRSIKRALVHLLRIVAEYGPAGLIGSAIVEVVAKASQGGANSAALTIMFAKYLIGMTFEMEKWNSLAVIERIVEHLHAQRLGYKTMAKTCPLAAAWLLRFAARNGVTIIARLLLCPEYEHEPGKICSVDTAEIGKRNDVSGPSKDHELVLTHRKSGSGQLGFVNDQAGMSRRRMYVGIDLDACEEPYEPWRVPKQDTLLHLAVDGGHQEILGFLIAAGSNVEMVDAQGKTPLLKAYNKGNAEAVQSLLFAGSKVHANSDVWCMALRHAVSQGKVPVFRALLRNMGELKWTALELLKEEASILG